MMYSWYVDILHRMLIFKSICIYCSYCVYAISTIGSVKKYNIFHVGLEFEGLTSGAKQSQACRCSVHHLTYSLFDWRLLWKRFGVISHRQRFNAKTTQTFPTHTNLSNLRKSDRRPKANPWRQTSWSGDEMLDCFNTRASLWSENAFLLETRTWCF